MFRELLVTHARRYLVSGAIPLFSTRRQDEFDVSTASLLTHHIALLQGKQGSSGG
jgi:hypothetical protein